MTLKQARRFVGIAAFERNGRTVVDGRGRKRKAYAIGGTKEHGEHCMLMAEIERLTTPTGK